MAITPAADVLEFMTRKVEILGQQNAGVLTERIQNHARAFVIKENNSDVIKWDIFEGGPANVYIREGSTAWHENVNEDPNLMTLRLARLYIPLEFTGLEVEHGRLIGKEQYVANVVKIAMNNAMFQFRRMIMSDHMEYLTSTTAANSGLTVAVASTKWLKKGMYIDFYRSGSAVTDGTQMKITAINKTTKVITYTGAATPTLAAGDDVIINGNYALGAYGLKAWLNDGSSAPGTDGTTTIGGQSRSASRPTLNAVMKRNGGTPRALSFELMDELVAEVYAGDAAANISAIYGSARTVYAYKKLLRDKWSIQTPTGVMDIAYGDNKYPAYANELLTPNQIPVISDPFDDDGAFYFVSEKDIGYHGDKTFRWKGNPNMIDGKFVYLGPISRKDVFAATMFAEFQITGNPSRHGVMVDIIPEMGDIVH